MHMYDKTYYSRWRDKFVLKNQSFTMKFMKHTMSVLMLSWEYEIINNTVGGLANQPLWFWDTLWILSIVVIITTWSSDCKTVSQCVYISLVLHVGCGSTPDRTHKRVPWLVVTRPTHPQKHFPSSLMWVVTSGGMTEVKIFHVELKIQFLVWRNT